MKISLLHPSRGRPEKSYNTTQRWLTKATHTMWWDIEMIVSLDTDDSAGYDYLKYYDGMLVNYNKSVVEATNRAASHCDGDILIYLSDDFDCPQDWDRLIIEQFENENRPLLLKVDDCLQPFHVPVLTIPIMNRSLYEKLGYFWHPEYKSMHVDVDLYHTVNKIGALKNAKHLKFPHEHHSLGKCENDETYKRSEANWNQGLEVFNRRKALGFPI